MLSTKPTRFKRTSNNPKSISKPLKTKSIRSQAPIRKRSLRSFSSTASSTSTNSNNSTSSSLNNPTTDNIPGISTHPQVLKRRAELQALAKTNPDLIKPISIGTHGRDYPPFVFVLGGPGTGKGTHCERLVEAAEKKLIPGLQDKIYHVNVGSILRKSQVLYREQKEKGQLSENMSKAGPVLEAMLATGQILPSWVTVTLLREELDQMLNEINKEKELNPNYNANIIIDGFPRSIENLESFENLIAIPSRLLIMDVPTDVMIERVVQRGQSSGREDDNSEVMKKRIHVFQSDTGQVLTQYCIQDSVEKALEYNKRFGVMRLGVKIFGDRPTHETSKDFIDAYISLSNTPIY